MANDFWKNGKMKKKKQVKDIKSSKILDDDEKESRCGYLDYDKVTCKLSNSKCEDGLECGINQSRMPSRVFRGGKMVFVKTK